MSNVRSSARLDTDWAERPSARWRLPPCPTPSWHGTDGSQARRAPGRPRIDREVEQLIVRMPDENRSWGYDRIVGALANLGHEISDQTVGNVLRRHGLKAYLFRRNRQRRNRIGHFVTSAFFGASFPNEVVEWAFGSVRNHREGNDR